MKRRIRLTIAYDGTIYAGWQAQPEGNTVQQRLEGCIAALSGEKTVVHGSGRTDAGVHARAQEAHFDTSSAWLLSNWQRGLNALLPPDIRITRVRSAPPVFHARRSVAFKEYRYRIWNADVLPPFLRLYRAHVLRPLDTERMREASALLAGCHDFASFTANPNREVADTKRTLSDLQVTSRGADITIRAVSEGFLYKMVRSLAGYLIRVGTGAVAVEETRRILNARQRTARVPTAPACGLFLWRVVYRRAAYIPPPMPGNEGESSHGCLTVQGKSDS